ncbi:MULTISPECIES: MCE family protein [Rhodococcus]|jgi:phospholipid/cholesterol/gamma-HCH transport system substrate-binding protein|uniref:MCE family protein n=1 Tax=Rhodococcus TaxID=1827 RepID=UPI0004A9A14E|nr:MULTISPECIES: MlaD family protein [Rhodococcus]ANQ75441.1 mammalian cell entry protein [Rhodococcus sp. 008]ARE37693.1 mammalian cell entry protein [Rhodococcus sp. BH4]KDQ04993.1 mammalian cell entry protein [Rhodococcus qingshengii]KSU65429.1 mammalian cell entry protein [Rhodococcus qingshengii]KZF15126.1 mammalian cell entry protein [Rhodococcus sp. EPR-134]
MRTKLVRTQLVIFTVVAIVAVGNSVYSYMGLKRFSGIGMYSVDVELERAGGLYPNALVTYRGVDVGVVESLDVNPDHVTVHMQLDSDHKIPQATDAYVRSVSAIGEQYVDLMPTTSEGPFLGDGDVIDRSRTTLPVPAAKVVDEVNTLLEGLPKEDLKTTVDEAYIAFDGAGTALSQLIDSTRPLIALAQANLTPTTTLIDDAEPVLAAANEAGSDITSFATDLASFTEQLTMNDTQIRGALDSGPAFFDAFGGTMTDLQPSLPLLLANLQSTGEVLRVNLPGLRQILVVYPALSAAINYSHLGVQGADRTYGQGPLDIKLGNTANPLPCTEGYGQTQRRDPGDLSPAEPAIDPYCKLPPNEPRVVRGARNLPCATDPAVRTAEVGECPGGLPSNWPQMLARPGQPYTPAPGEPPTTPEQSDSSQPTPVTATPASWDISKTPAITTSPYDPITGTFRAPDGTLYSIDATTPTRSKEELTWQSLLLR